MSDGRTYMPLALLSEGEMILRYQRVAHTVASQFFFPGHSRDDVHQEALIGLLNAARCYDGSTRFETWAAFVIRRHLVSCLKQAQALKHQPLNDARRIALDDEGDPQPAVDVIADPVTLDQIVAARDELAKIREAMHTLSPLERDRLSYVVNGGTYPQGALRDKQLENGVDRARRKLRAAA